MTHPARPAALPRHEDPPAPPRCADMPPVTRPQHHRPAARRAVQARELHITAGHHVGIDRQRARPYDGHRRQHRHGSLPASVANEARRDPSRSGGPPNPRPAVATGGGIIAKEHGRTAAGDAQEVRPSTTGSISIAQPCQQLRERCGTVPARGLLSSSQGRVPCAVRSGRGRSGPARVLGRVPGCGSAGLAGACGCWTTTRSGGSGEPRRHRYRNSEGRTHRGRPSVRETEGWHAMSAWTTVLAPRQRVNSYVYSGQEHASTRPT